MEFTGTTFIFLFLPILLAVYYFPLFKKNRSLKNVILVLSSLCFYGCGEPIMIILLIGIIMFNYVCGKFISKGKWEKGICIFSVAINLAVLFGFKYINAIIKLLPGEHTNSILLPLGISYYVFSAVSYIMDIRKNKAIGAASLLETALHICFFGRITCGPIIQYRFSIAEIRNRTESIDNILTGVQRFSIGLAKKVIIANQLSDLVSTCFDSSELSVCMAWLGAIGYTLQIFFDFSGYSDMAIGVGLMFGFHFPENFNYPYCAKSVCDFWNRWHISLTKWFTQYVYIPLGGSRVKTVWRHLFNLLVVWLFTGIWHGSSLTFILWGLIYFVFQVAEKYTCLGKIGETKVLGRIYTLFIVVILWVIFRASTLPDAWYYIKAMFGIGASSFCDEFTVKKILTYLVPILFGCIFSMPIWQVIKSKCNNQWICYVEAILIVVLFVFSICLQMGGNYVAPMYAGF